MEMSDSDSDLSSYNGFGNFASRNRGLTIESSAGGTFLDNENSELKRKVMALESTVRRNEEDLAAEK